MPMMPPPPPPPPMPLPYSQRGRSMSQPPFRGRRTYFPPNFARPPYPPPQQQQQPSINFTRPVLNQTTTYHTSYDENIQQQYQSNLKKFII